MAQPLLEVQVHPPDIRRRVLYLFLQRSHLWWGAAGVVTLVAFVTWGFSMIPLVAENQVARQEYRELERVRGQQGERLKSLLSRLEQVSAGAGALRVRMEKIDLAYGLPPTPAHGQGTRPVTAAGAPQSIYADTIAHGNRLQAGVQEQLAVVAALMRDVQGFEAQHRELVALTPSVCPLSGRDFVLTSPFGLRRDPFTRATGFHAGLDLAAPVGTAVHATAAGVVAFAGHFDPSRSAAWWRYGNLVILRHGDRFVSLYGHLQDIEVKVGQRVEQGQQVGTVGNSGWSTSPHLHYEVRRRDGDEDYHPIDPRIYILDHRWRDEERLLARARVTPDPSAYEPLPALRG